MRSDNLLLNRDGVLKIGEFLPWPVDCRRKLGSLRLTLADFSNAVTITPESPTCTGVVGVIYWQAPEVRAYVHCFSPFSPYRFSSILYFIISLYSGTYSPTKADVWSLGATVWEMAESAPPFHDAVSAGDLRDRWPPLTRAGDFSRSLHDFLVLCSNPIAARPDVSVLAQVGIFFLGDGCEFD